MTGLLQQPEVLLLIAGGALGALGWLSKTTLAAAFNGVRYGFYTPIYRRIEQTEAHIMNELQALRRDSQGLHERVTQVSAHSQHVEQEFHDHRQEISRQLERLRNAG